MRGKTLVASRVDWIVAMGNGFDLDDRTLALDAVVSGEFAKQPFLSQLLRIDLSL